MSISDSKRNFLKKIVHGFNVLFETENQSDRIGKNPVSPTERFIKGNLLDYDGYRYTFSTTKFKMGMVLLHPDAIQQLFDYFDNVNIPLKKVIHKSTLNFTTLDEDERKFVDLVNTYKINTFYDFVILD